MEAAVAIWLWVFIVTRYLYSKWRQDKQPIAKKEASEYPYDKRSRMFRQSLTEGRNCKQNKLYLASNYNFYFYVDKNGYFHKIESKNKIIDSILLPNGAWEYVCEYRDFEECSKKIE